MILIHERARCWEIKARKRAGWAIFYQRTSYLAPPASKMRGFDGFDGVGEWVNEIKFDSL